MKQRFKFVVEFEADRDMIPGWGHQAEDFHRLATEPFGRPSGYNMTAKVVSSEIVSPKD